MFPIRDSNRTSRFPIMNWLLILANALVFFYEISLGDGQLNEFIYEFAMMPAKLQSDPQTFAFTVLTSMFMHAGWFHFLSNVWILHIFGDNVEDRMGPIRYLIFYLLGGVAAALLETYVSPGSQIPVLGASGAIAGVLGAYVLLFPGARVRTAVFLIFISIMDLPAVIFIGFWFVSQLFSGLASIGATATTGVAWWAHIGGFAMGLLLCGLFARRQRPAQIDYL
ncbi:MAG: rhomboid family intramembrane serine protease [Anaerolineales bacterium]|nr:rhomboid family intramembrane serine protease [Anaerolineales bacterium]MCW5855773.1 rhomboid family intramembrane serine protease [Anaerolineales bacterium]